MLSLLLPEFIGLGAECCTVAKSIADAVIGDIYFQYALPEFFTDLFSC